MGLAAGLWSVVGHMLNCGWPTVSRWGDMPPPACLFEQGMTPSTFMGIGGSRYACSYIPCSCFCFVAQLHGCHNVFWGCLAAIALFWHVAEVSCKRASNTCFCHLSVTMRKRSKTNIQMQTQYCNLLGQHTHPTDQAVGRAACQSVGLCLALYLSSSACTEINTLSGDTCQVSATCHSKLRYTFRTYHCHDDIGKLYIFLRHYIIQKHFCVCTLGLHI